MTPRLDDEVQLLSPDAAEDEALVDALARVVNGAYAVGEAGLWLEGTTRTTPAEIADAIRSGGVLAATDDGRVVGCAYVRPMDAATADLGLGSRLVRSAEDLMRSRGATTMQLEVLVPKGWSHPAKDRLRDWYTRLGYRVVGSAPLDQVAAHLAPQLATSCELLIFHKQLAEVPQT